MRPKEHVMAIELSGTKRRIGLTLSGGGFRAAAFLKWTAIFGPGHKVEN